MLSPTQRLVKQVIYGSFFAAAALFCLLSLVVLGISAQPRPIASPTPVAAEPIVVELVELVSHSQSVDVVARVRNPNLRIGVEYYALVFVIENSRGEAIARHTETTYLLPNSLQFVVALDVPLSETAASVRVEQPEQPIFTELPVAVDLPSFGSFVRERSQKQIGTTIVEEQKGIVSNNSTFDFQRVEIITVALNSAGQTIGVGRTFAGNLAVGERREFTVQWPLPPTATQRVIIAPTTNTFRQENIIRVIGNPRSLQ